MESLSWFDAHLDLAYLALLGRAMHQPLVTVQLAEPAAAVTIPNLAAAGVKGVLATIFVQPWSPDPSHVDGPWCFRNSLQAHQAAKAQLTIYQRWYQSGLLQRPGAVNNQSNAPVAWLLMEGCDGIRDVDDLDYFYGQGLCAISLTWTQANRWAAGNESYGGLTADGRRLLQRSAALGLILDVSHLAERGFFEVLDEYPGRVVASHSNVRALLPAGRQSQRNLTDDQIRRLAAAGGIMGINLYSKFLAAGRATIENVIGHIRRAAELTGSMTHVGLGSDMDGGFDAHSLPVNLESHTELARLAAAMWQAGFSDEDIRRFAFDNWSSIMEDEANHQPSGTAGLI